MRCYYLHVTSLWLYKLLVVVLILWVKSKCPHCSDVIMSAMVSQITGAAIVYSIVCLVTDHGKHLSSASLAFVRGIHRQPVNSPHKEPVTRKMFPFAYIIMIIAAAAFYTQQLNINWFLRHEGRSCCLLHASIQYKLVPETGGEILLPSTRKNSI